MIKRNTKNLIDIVSENTNIDKNICKEVIEGLVDQIKYDLLQGGSVCLTGLVSMKTKDMKAKEMYNTKFKKKMPIKARRFLSMIPSDVIKEELKILDNIK